MIAARSRWGRRGLVALFSVSLLASAAFAGRSYHSLLLLRSAYQVDAPDLGQLRPWMTLDYVARLYGLPEGALAARLELEAGTPSTTTLRSLAQRGKQRPFAYLQRVQRVIAALQPHATARNRGAEASGWGELGDRLLATLLVYGYPTLGLTLLLGSIGVPLPSGLLTIVAGSLVAQQRMTWFAVATVAVSATVLGDVAGYGLGRVLNREFLAQRGRWLGYTTARQQQVQRLFERWGLVSVLLTRTLVSTVSPVVNLAAGASRYRPGAFVLAAVAGRVVWTLAYLGLGFGVGGALEAAAGFLQNLTGLLVSVAVLLWAGLLAFRRRAG